MCSTVSAAVDEVLAGAADPGEEIVALLGLADRVQAALVERVAQFDAAEGWEADGAYSFACWLRARADVSRGEAGQLRRFARTLRTMPATEAAVADGKLSVAKARVLAEVINPRTRARFDEQETFLVDQVQGLDLDAARVAARYCKQRLASADQWIALHVRDRGCVAPGCDRPAAWCQAHHLAWWDRDHGATDLANLCLVCTAHHHLIHDQGWTLHPQRDGTWQLNRPDGSAPGPPRYPWYERPPALRRARPSEARPRRQGCSDDERRAQPAAKLQRVAPPGSTVASAVARRGVRRYTSQGGGPADGAL